MHNRIKSGNLGALTDIALTKHKSTYAQQAAYAGLINVIFAACVFAFGWLGLAVIWPAMPNFTGNQTITDGIILGIFSILMLLVVALFLAWQSAASIVICKQHDSGNSDNLQVVTVIKAARPAASVLFAVILVFAPFLVVFALIAVTNFSLAPPLLFVLFLILTVLRAISFYAVNMALEGEYRFLSALVHSAKMVARQGAVGIYAIVATITTINLAAFLGLFFVFLTIFGQFPANIFDFAETLQNPMGIGALLFLAYLITIFITPRMQILAYTLYAPTDLTITRKHPGPASRSLAAALDIIIVAAVFAVCFYAAVLLVSGGNFALSQINIFAAIIAIIAFFAVYVIYNVFFEVYGGGQTPAKRVFGLIVNGAAQNPRLLQSLVRNILRIADVFGFVAIAFAREHRRLGDFLSLMTVEYKKESDNVS